MWLFLNIIFLGWRLHVGLAQYFLLDDLEMLAQERNVTEPLPTGIGTRYQKLPKPSITVKPWIAVLNGNVTIHCKADKPYNMLDFYLLKKGRYSWTAKAAYLDSVDYPIINVTKRLLGWYYCIYCARTQLGRQCSEESEDANISLIDPILPKAFVKVIPQELMLTDLNASIACRVPMKGLTVTLFKSGNMNASQELTNKSDTAFFLLYGLKIEDSGNYSCRYKVGDFIFSVLSNPAQFIVKELPKLTLWSPVIAGLLVLSLLLPSLITLLLLKRRRDAILRSHNQPVEDTNQPVEDTNQPMEHISSTLVENTSGRSMENTSDAQSTSVPQFPNRKVPSFFYSL